MPSTATVWQFKTMEDSGCSIMGRVVLPATAAYITQAAFGTITVSYRRIDGTGPVTTTSLTVSSVVYDTLQTTARLWTKDSIGFNFKWDAAATIFTQGNGRYAVTFLFTPSSGAAFKVPCEVNVQKDMAA